MHSNEAEQHLSMPTLRIHLHASECHSMNGLIQTRWLFPDFLCFPLLFISFLISFLFPMSLIPPSYSLLYLLFFSLFGCSLAFLFALFFLFKLSPLFLSPFLSLSHTSSILSPLLIPLLLVPFCFPLLLLLLFLCFTFSSSLPLFFCFL